MSSYPLNLNIRFTLLECIDAKPKVFISHWLLTGILPAFTLPALKPLVVAFRYHVVICVNNVVAGAQLQSFNQSQHFTAYIGHSCWRLVCCFNALAECLHKFT